MKKAANDAYGNTSENALATFVRGRIGANKSEKCVNFYNCFINFYPDLWYV